jgi:hypothetical protein
VAVFVPNGKSPMVYVGELTEKCPFLEESVAETLDNVE